ncbi:helicase C-terminal domain-containing protein [Achromobacter xylosoxidans]
MNYAIISEQFTATVEQRIPKTAYDLSLAVFFFTTMTLPATLPASATGAPSLILPSVTQIFAALTSAFGLSPRASQLELAQIVESTVLSGGISCVEAPTGTGKTLGYLAGALAAQARMANFKPIVVATATVGLQEQILNDDIPRLETAGLLDSRKVAVAKGRGRYFCPRTAALLEDKKAQDNQFDMFDGEKQVADAGVPIALDMLRAWRTKEWDGDKDSWTGTIPECWASACGASSDTCVNRACEHFESCPYMASRQRLATAQLIIANHDIVLADLTQRSEEQSNTVLPPKSYALIFDEAHNLPEKAVSKKMALARLSETDWLRKLETYGETCLNTPRIAKAMSRATDFGMDVFSVGAATLIADLDGLAAVLGTIEFNESGLFSWGLKEPERELLEQTLFVGAQALKIHSALQTTSKAFTEFAEEAVGAEKTFAIRMLAMTHSFQRHAKELFSGFELFCSSDKLVRWVSRKSDGSLALHTQPLEGRDVLTELLWSKDITTVLVSATLQIAGSFDRFRDKSGLPGHAVTKALPAVFDYSRGYLHQPEMETVPGDPAHEKELVRKLELLFRQDVSPGMLVLFTSREAMRRVTRALPDDMAAVMLTQDRRPVPELVAEHKARIARGERSILAGLDSMAEGLDLPGNNCGHVVITRLPFAVPGDPVEEARRDALGKDWFEQAYLADMLIMLIQSTGRLIRREADHGVITVLDKRLWTKRYALTAYSALPSFSRGPKLRGYFEMLAARGISPALPAGKGARESKPARRLSLVPPHPAPTVHEAKPSVEPRAPLRLCSVSEDDQDSDIPFP